MNDTWHQTLTLSGTDPSEAVDLSGRLLSGLYLPTGLDSTALTFQAADEQDGTYLAVYNSAGNQVSVTVAAERHVLLEPETFAGARWLKVVPGTSQSPDLEITLIFVENT